MKWIKNNIEIVAWCIALLIPFFINPYHSDYFSFCFFKTIGIYWCPGCGLGQSIAYLYQGEWLLSLKTHWLGIITVLFLLLRITQLLCKAKYKIPKPTIV